MGLSILLFALFGATCATCPGTDSLSDGNVTHVLNIHNLWRGEAALGGIDTSQRTLPAGENIYKVEWSCTLEDLAKQAVQNCPTTKTVNPTYGQAFMHLNSTTSANERAQALNTSLTLWPQEADTEDIGNNVVNMGNEKLLNFMNMIRANTYQVGCAEKMCTGTATAVCFYNQPDLKMNELVYKAGNNCTNGGPCSTYSGSTCETSSGLCLRGNDTATTTAAPTTTTVQAETMPTNTAQNTRCPQNQGMTNTIRTRFLDMHNARRKHLAEGEALTTNNQKMLRSADMMRLRWNCGLEAAALTHARTCTFAKSSESSRPNDGENQATVDAATSYQDAAEKAVKSWWKTIRSVGGVGRDRIFQQSFVNTTIEGFTQMAWAKTRKLGCAVVNCSGRYNVVCRYNEKGNTVGQVIYNRGRPCSQCPQGTRCVENLCVWN